ncbi:MAG: hypothetical protein R3264_00735 [Anaerolineae bacterium]|nr:hypothetical protein [Anaerolineae bacterium]
MPNPFQKQVFTLSVLVALVLMSIFFTTQALAIGNSQANTLTRDLEPVVITGIQATAFIGASVDDLFVYTFNGSSLSGQIPIQVDELSAGNYVTVEDGILDADDEIVIMAMDLGERKPATTALTATLPISDTWYQIEVTDSLNPAKKGWAYLVRSSSLSPSFADDYANYVAGPPPRITASKYDLRYKTGVADPFFGIDYLALNGSGTNILDRTKLRVVASVFGFPFTFTEESLSNPATTLIKDGPIRVILQQTATASSAGQQQATYKAYGSFVEGIVKVDFSSVGFNPISSARTSYDLNSALANQITFLNANTPAAVTVDGNPDSVAATPLSKWTQINHNNSGRLVQVGNPASAGGTQTNFYRDNSTPESNDTGQPGSYGDAGVLVQGSINSAFSLRSSLYVLPYGGGAKVGPTYESYFNSPLLVSTGFQGAPPPGTIFLPLILKNSN